MEDKKKVILSVVGVLVLVAMIVGISYALYTFSGTGQTVNLINTGKISISMDNGETVQGHEKSVINLENVYPVTDATGVAQDKVGEHTKIDIISSVAGSQTFYYVVYLTEVTPSEGLATKNVKISLFDKTTEVVAKAYLSSFATKKATVGATTITDSYAIYNGSFSGSEGADLDLKAWVAETDADGAAYELHTTTDTTGEAVTAADNKYTHTKTAGNSELSFKVQVAVYDSAITIA